MSESEKKIKKGKKNTERERVFLRQREIMRKRKRVSERGRECVYDRKREKVCVLVCEREPETDRDESCDLP